MFLYNSIYSDGKWLRAPRNLYEKTGKKENKIAFIVNFKLCTITIDINDGEINEIIIKNIPKGPDIQYKFAITVFTQNTCLEFLDE